MTTPLDEKGLEAARTSIIGNPFNDEQLGRIIRAYLSAVALSDELEVVIERLRPKHLADEPLARAVVSDDHMERRRAVSAYLVENNALKSEAVTAISQAHSTIAALRAEVEHWRGEARRLLKSGQEALDAAETAEAEVKRLTEENEALRVALGVADEALCDWLNTYASDVCSPVHAEAAQARLREHGTIAYIAGKLKIIRAALSGSKE